MHQRYSCVDKVCMSPNLSRSFMKPCQPPLHDYGGHCCRQLPLYYGHYSWSQLPWKVTWIKQLTISGKRNAGPMATIVDT